jgi:hypothetical protein
MGGIKPLPLALCPENRDSLARCLPQRVLRRHLPRPAVPALARKSGARPPWRARSAGRQSTGLSSKLRPPLCRRRTPGSVSGRFAPAFRLRASLGLSKGAGHQRLTANDQRLANLRLTAHALHLTNPWARVGTGPAHAKGSSANYTGLTARVLKK